MMMFGGLFFVLSLHHLSWLVWQRPDVWWTPQPMSVPFAEVDERVEVRVWDAPIQQETQAGRLQWLTQAGVTPLGPADARLRFNNWDRIRVAKMPNLLAAAACAGASGAVLLLGILGWIPSKSQNPGRRAPT